MSDAGPIRLGEPGGLSYLSVVPECELGPVSWLGCVCHELGLVFVCCGGFLGPVRPCACSLARIESTEHLVADTQHSCWWPTLCMSTGYDPAKDQKACLESTFSPRPIAPLHMSAPNSCAPPTSAGQQDISNDDPTLTVQGGRHGPACYGAPSATPPAFDISVTDEFSIYK